MFVFLLFPDEMFPPKNKRSEKGVHREKGGICPHCGEVRSYKICYKFPSCVKRICTKLLIAEASNSTIQLLIIIFSSISV